MSNSSQSQPVTATANAATPSAGPAAAFTPGPWLRSGVRRKIDGMDNHAICATVDGQEIIIASVWYDPKTHAGFHDASLIAAAPELLAALRDCLGWHDFADDLHKPIEVRAAYMRARSAIAKATGS